MNCFFSSPRLSSLAALALSVVATSPTLHAASAIWTGNTDTAWKSNSNWNPSTTYPGTDFVAPPAEANHLDIATFNTVAASTNQPNVAGDITIGELQFATSGWTISGGRVILRAHSDTFGQVAGLNTISANLRTTFDNQRIRLATDNTLLLTGQLDIGGRLQLQNIGGTSGGGGTMVVAGTQVATTQSGITVLQDTTLLINTDMVATGANNNNFNYIAGGTSTLGGTGSLSFTSSARMTVGSGATLSPGGNGVHGAEIGTFGVSVTAARTMANAPVLMESGSILRIQLGASEGINDLLSITSTGGDGGFLNLLAGGATLDLFGAINQTPGLYTFATFDTVAGGSADYGTFGTVNYNGVALAPSFGSISYGTDSISFNVIPEPSTFALLGLGLVAIGLRRKRHSQA